MPYKLIYLYHTCLTVEITSQTVSNARTYVYHDVIIACVSVFVSEVEIEKSLQWRRTEYDGVSNYRRIGGLLNRMFRSKKISKSRVTGLWEGNPPVTGGFPSQGASNAERISIWWRHHVCAVTWYASPDIMRGVNARNNYLIWFPAVDSLRYVWWTISRDNNVSVLSCDVKESINISPCFWLGLPNSIF